MRTVLILILSMLVTGVEARAQQPRTGRRPTASLGLIEAGHSQTVDLQVTVDDLPYDEYWTKTFDAIFEFADGNSDGALTEEEIRRVPSARAVRLSLGSAFTPPLAPIQSLKEIVETDSKTCSKVELRRYYLRHGAGQLQIGYGELSNTAAITAALVKALDDDHDGQLTQTELLRAESTLRRLDTNDDELIGIGELIPNGTYPGSAAANALKPSNLKPSKDVDLTSAGDSSLVLKRFPTQSDADSTNSGQASSGPHKSAVWQINISDHVRDLPLSVATKAYCQSWSVHGPLLELFRQLTNEIAKAEAGSLEKVPSTNSRNRGSSRAWLTPLADRDGNGDLSQQEVDSWLGLQRQLIQGQLLISIYYGGGLFELLDTNHDAGLSIRELRGAWQILKAASCASDVQVDFSRIPNVVFFVASQGYPGSLAKTSVSEVEWFRKMDRNADGDVSRREFTSSPNTFKRLDQDQDGLISALEAEANN